MRLILSFRNHGDKRENFVAKFNSVAKRKVKFYPLTVRKFGTCLFKLFSVVLCVENWKFVEAKSTSSMQRY